MHAVLTRVAAVLMAVALGLVVGAPHAAGEYQTVLGGLEQWVWVRSGVPMNAAVVRNDGWLVVATGQRFDGQRMVGGNLVLVPPWGGDPIPFGDPPDPKTKSFGFTSLVARGDRLFGLTSMPDQNSPVGQRARLIELDARSGKVLASHGTWWFPDLAVDPQTNDLVLWTFTCTGECGPEDSNLDDNNEEVVGAVTHQLVRYNPERRETTAVLLPDAMEADIGGSGTCASRRDALRRCEEVFRIAFSHDGNLLFLGTTRTGNNAIDVRDRNGAFRYSVPAPRPVDSMRFGTPASCLANALVLTSSDGATWAIPNAADPAAASREARQLASGAPGGVSSAALTPDGNVLTLRRSEGVLLSCPGTKRVDPPRPNVVAAPPAATAAPAPAATQAGPPPAAPSAPAPNAPPPVQPPSMPAVAGPASHATQAATGLNIGLADAEEEQPVYSLSASRRDADTTTRTWASLAIGAAAAAGFALITFLSIPNQQRARAARPALLRGDIRR